MPETKRSPWVYVGIGCLVVTVVGVIVVGGAIWYASRALKQFEADMKDPAAQDAKAKRLLGCTQLPSGYRAFVSMSVPLIMDMVILSDREPGAPGRRGLGERGFLYTSIIANGTADREDLRAFLEGRQHYSRVLAQQRIGIGANQTIGRGRFTNGAASVTYAAQRGELEYAQSSHTGVQGLLLIECPKDGRLRFAVWFVPDPAPSDAVAQDLSGTPADESALRAFVSPFRFCPA
jgi:hypothetical protein